jgi:hypothetical protein
MVSGSRSTETLSSVLVFAPLFQLHMQASDLSLIPGGLPAQTSRPPAPANTSDPSAPGPFGLSTPVLVGIIVAGAVVAIAALCAAAFLCIRRRKRAAAATRVIELAGDDKHRPATASTAPSGEYFSPKAEGGDEKRAELEVPPVFEAPATPRQRRSRAELP